MRMDEGGLVQTGEVPDGPRGVAGGPGAMPDPQPGVAGVRVGTVRARAAAVGTAGPSAASARSIRPMSGTLGHEYRIAESERLWDRFIDRYNDVASGAYARHGPEGGCRRRHRPVLWALPVRSSAMT